MIIKRIFDIIVSFIGLLFLWPAMLLIAIIVKVTSKGPVFFIQKRIGRSGLLFDCIKFRTMVIDSEKKGTITVATDKRITKIGGVLRKCKLDELPQLWNVFIGKMSFVGPRPDVSGYADKLHGENRKILQLRPGITGPATLYFRNEEMLLTKVKEPVKFNDSVIWPMKVKINSDYLESWSFWKDLGYIIITVLPFFNKIFKLVKEPPKIPEECKASDI